MRERYNKVLTKKLEEYLPSDVATKILEAYLGGKPPPLFFECVCVWGGSKFVVKVMVPSVAYDRYYSLDLPG